MAIGFQMEKLTPIDDDIQNHGVVCVCTNSRYQATSSSPCDPSIRLHAHNAREWGDLDNYSRKLLSQI